MCNLFLVLLFAFVSLQIYGEEVVINNFEKGHDFVAEESALSVINSRDYASEGERSLKIIFEELVGSKKGYIKTKATSSWTGATAVKLDVYNPNNVDLQCAFFVQLGANWDWNESILYPLPIGETKDVVFQLDEAIWKNSASSWQFTNTIQASEVVEYGFMVYPIGAAPAGEVFVDNIRLIKDNSQVIDIEVEEPINTNNIGKVKISGDVELTVTSEEVKVPLGDIYNEFDMNISRWESEYGVILPNDIVKVEEDGKDAILVSELGEGTAFKYQFSDNPVDLSEYDRIDIEMKTTADVYYQIVPRHGDDDGGAWDYQEQGNISQGDWQTISLRLADIPDVDWTKIHAISFQHWNATTDIYIASIRGVNEGEYETEIEINRTHKATIRGDYKIDDNWDAAAAITFADPFARLILVEVKGQLEKADVRGFYNGKAFDTSDPYTIFKGEKYHEDKTLGFEVIGMVEDIALKGAVLMPLNASEQTNFFNDEIGNPLLVADASYNIDDLTTVGSVLVYENLEEDDRYRAGVYGLKSWTSGVKIDGEFVFGKGEKDRAFFGKAIYPTEQVELELGIEYGDEGYWADYSDKNTTNYRKVYLDGNLPEYSVGFYIQNWARVDDTYNGFFNKAFYDYTFTDKLTLKSEAVLTFKKDSDIYVTEGNEDKTYLKLDFVINPSVENLNANIIALLREDAKSVELKELKLNRPAIVGLVTYKPVPGLELYGELGIVKNDPEGDFTNNIFAKITKSVGEGNLELSYGKETFEDNDDQNKIVNAETVDNYFTMKYTVEF